MGIQIIGVNGYSDNCINMSPSVSIRGTKFSQTEADADGRREDGVAAHFERPHRAQVTNALHDCGLGTGRQARLFRLDKMKIETLFAKKLMFGI